MTGEQARWLCDLLSGPDRIPDHIHVALASAGLVTKQGPYSVLTQKGRERARTLMLK